MRKPNTWKPLVIAAGVLLTFSLTLAACSSPGDADDNEKVTLRFSYLLSEQTSIGELWSWWMDQVESRTNGSITFDAYWDETLVKGTEVIESLNDGRVDVAQIVPTLYTSTFPVTSVHELPFQSSNSPAVSAAMATLAENGPIRDEFANAGVIPVAWAIGSPSALGTKKPVRKVEDLKNVRIRGNDRGSKVLAAAGANVTNLETSEVYTALDRGLLDGVYGIPFAFIGPLKYTEVINNFTDTGMGVASAYPLAIGDHVWESLSDKQQAIIKEVSAEVPTKVGEFDAKYDDASCEAAKDADSNLFVLSEKEVKRLKATGYQQVLDEWKATAADADANPDQVLKDYQDTVAAEESNYPDYQAGLVACAELQ